MEPVRFRGRIRFWDPVRATGLAVADVPPDDVAALGGLKQQRVRGTLNEVDFASSIMPAGGGRLALSVSKAMMKSAGARIGDEVEIRITAAGRDS